MAPPLIVHWNPHFYPFVGGISSYIDAICSYIGSFDHLILTNRLSQTQRRERFGPNSDIVRFGPRDIVHSPVRGIGHTIATPASAVGDIVRGIRERRFLRRKDPSILHVHDVDWNLVRLDVITGRNFGGEIACRIFAPREGKPSLLTKHFLYKRGLVSEKFLRWERALTLQYSTIVCVDREIEKSVRQWSQEAGLERKIHFIPNSVDTMHFRPRPLPSFARLRVGFLARLDAARGEAFLRRFLLNLPDYVEFYGAIASEPVRFDWFSSQFSSGRIHLRRNVPQREVPDFLSNIHVLLNPLEVDYPVTRSALEAMACGRCVLMFGKCERYPLIPGKTVIFTSPELREVTAKLQELQENPEILATIGSKAREVVAAEFSHDKVLPQLERLYTDLLDQSWQAPSL